MDLRPAVLLPMMLVAVVLPARADDPVSLRIVGQDRQFVVQTPTGPFTITRTTTDSTANKGTLQPLVPAPGVRPVTEIDVLAALNDPDTMVIDMRDEDDPLEVAIPNTYHIPYNEVEDRLNELGCTREGKGPWDCRKARQVVAFCNGPVCLQSPVGIVGMIRAGFPVGKIAYYRGGIMDWKALGLTTVRGNRVSE